MDVHAFSRGRKLILCGTEIPAEKGLAGHSDGDVALHALMDAILGALGLPDIGFFFPSTPKWKNVSSLELLGIVRGKMEELGFALVNADIALLLEKPKISSLRQAMLAELHKIFPRAALNIKASTAEGLGFVGRSEGILALATVLLEKNG